MIYSTIRPKHCKIAEVKSLDSHIIDVALQVGKDEGVTITHALVSETGAVYAYSDNEEELKTMAIAFDAVITQMSV